MDRHAEEARLAFGAWLATLTGRSGLVGQLVEGAATDRRFPRAGNAEAVRRHLSAMQVDGDMFDAVDDAEAEWRSL